MKVKFVSVLLIFCAVLYTAISCSKTAASASGSTTSASVAGAIASLQAIAVGSTGSSSSALDSIYVINTCSRHSIKDSILFRTLPAAVLDYLDSNYSGYTAQQAYSITDASGTAAGYIAIIQYNGSPVGLKFSATGAFINILEQRLGSQLEGCEGKDSTDNDSTGTKR